MTPAYIDERWQAAIMPVALGVIGDQHEFTEEGMQESVKRLSDLGVPGWASHLRLALLTWNERPWEPWGPEFILPWHPDFAIRSATALVGIQLRTPNEQDLKRTYQRLFIRFLTETLRPFMAFAQQAGKYRQGNYTVLNDLFALCERFACTRQPTHQEEWDALWERSESKVFAYAEEEPHVLVMTKAMLTVARSLLDPNDATPWTDSRAGALGSIIEGVTRQYQWRVDGYGSSDYLHTVLYAKLLADAYLTALEAICPTPDWLP